MGPQTLIIKKGEHGALLFGENNQTFFCPALPLEDVFDPTGAGDTFAGGFIGFLASVGRTDFEAMKTAIIYGSAMASFCVEEFGTTKLASITKADLDARLDQFKSLMGYEIVE
jgi:sugar/nucleoside kinase (ribokinase family)